MFVMVLQHFSFSICYLRFTQNQPNKQTIVMQLHSYFVQLYCSFKFCTFCHLCIVLSVWLKWTVKMHGIRCALMCFRLSTFHPKSTSTIYEKCATNWFWRGKNKCTSCTEPILFPLRKPFARMFVHVNWILYVNKLFHRHIEKLDFKNDWFHIRIWISIIIATQITFSTALMMQSYAMPTEYYSIHLR